MILSVRAGWAWVLGTVLMAACATSGGGPGAGQVSGDTYVNAQKRFGFRVPSGWEQVREAGLFASAPPWVVRFASPGGDASVTVYSASLASDPCLQTASGILEEHVGAGLSRTESFTVATPDGEVPAWRGVVEGTASQGGAAIFCAGGEVQVLAGVATPTAFSSHSEELERSIRSFAYAGAPQLVRLAPPTPTPAYFVHEIEWRGQTLGQIAQWYTGEYGNWTKLTDLNDLTKHGVPLRVGRRIKIPDELVTNRKSMPRPRPKAPATPAPTPTPAVIGPDFLRGS